jgi:hypothetical protein
MGWLPWYRAGWDANSGNDESGNFTLGSAC